MIVLDANVLIGFLDASDAHHESAIALIETHIGEGLACNVLTVAEALVRPTSVGRQVEALASLGAIGVKVLPLDETQALGLAEVRDRFGIRMPDAVALHAALTHTSRLATFDERLAAAASRAGVTVVGARDAL